MRMKYKGEERQIGSSGTSNQEKAPARKVAFDYLRAIAVLLVLLHHAVHAYLISAVINLENPIATATPVVNEGRWPIFDLLVIYNETFLMPLLFFVSGLFVWRSIKRTGARNFLRRRLIRLGLPFFIGLVFLIPPAYYPAQLQVNRITGVDLSYGRFWLDMARSGFGTAGPLWFLWLLLAFDCLAVLLFRAVPDLGELIRTRSAGFLSSPGGFFGALLGVTMAVYLPAVMLIGPLVWVGIGPFQVQISRLLLYLAYFLAGLVIGACGINRTLFRSEGPLAKHPWGWLAVSLFACLIFAFMVVAVTPGERTIRSEIAFVLCGCAAVFGWSGLFLRYAEKRNRILASLSANSYGIYLVHYVFVTWLQYSLLENALAPSLKGSAVFAGAWLLSWGTAAALRRIPAAAKLI